MNKIYFLIIVALLGSMVLTAQKLSVVVKYESTEGSSNNNNIIYQPSQFLGWDDFKGKPQEGSDAAALTNAGFGLKLQFRRVENSSQLVISVSCSFSRKDSWVKPGNKTAYILNHEQKHFDIAFIHTQIFIQHLRSAPLTNANYAAVIEKVYKETALAMSKTQNQYDAETSHSRIPGKQAEWDEKINKLLAATINEN